MPRKDETQEQDKLSYEQVARVLDRLVSVPGNENDGAAIRRAVENAKAHWATDEGDPSLWMKGIGPEYVTKTGVETESGANIQPSIHARLSGAPTPRMTGLEAQGKVAPQAANEEVADTYTVPTKGRHGTTVETTPEEEKREEQGRRLRGQVQDEPEEKRGRRAAKKEE